MTNGLVVARFCSLDIVGAGAYQCQVDSKECVA
jgi:hypothetical protein